MAPQKQDGVSGTDWFVGKGTSLEGKHGCTAVVQESLYHRGFICVSLGTNASPRGNPIADRLVRVSASLLDLEPR